MSKKNFWKIEYSVTLFILIGILMFLIPMKFENYYQAGLISAWNERYDEVSYMFTVINAQKNDEILKSFSNTADSQLREKLLMQLVKPYLRLQISEKIPKRYYPKYMNGDKVLENDEYNFKDMYFSENCMQIVGIKDIEREDENSPWFMMMFDVNGVLPPNTWGKDIYGIYIYNEGKIKPFGYDKTQEDASLDCSEIGSGISCSYYYRIGGGFSD